MLLPDPLEFEELSSELLFAVGTRCHGILTSSIHDPRPPLRYSLIGVWGWAWVVMMVWEVFAQGIWRALLDDVIDNPRLAPIGIGDGPVLMTCRAMLISAPGFVVRQSGRGFLGTRSRILLGRHVLNYN
jgi:hypothetical protein